MLGKPRSSESQVDRSLLKHLAADVGLLGHRVLISDVAVFGFG